uniref:GRIP domain-containing protein n=1 Tax=Mucochytrium quahogii TaxID=96639 RepID=A0A7S2WRS9_9STRA|mmetsp:Transcript_39044/g.63030  ORF Transcript_39044/g.63030 Transcript_39044/m.63030 type:complete len:960 (-) Transcript_39044:106-2985(-)|eukprot:CAMPEP_0203765498 /NCGR_PEP_ID=MMETSP0098-20131031/18444_1 /ASSEMBLY_ACC=CAM_ASM_000208 /TAXON_ID=96639 /ORGANISM=" , Strain NY0313808BC1" /LENGTH=959 /DNA_ID=CAMNT_0050661757 /DNA_START=1034 /DNA_END=3913 /DNA_ORIENTATION=-
MLNAFKTAVTPFVSGIIEEVEVDGNDEIVRRSGGEEGQQDSLDERGEVENDGVNGLEGNGFDTARGNLQQEYGYHHADDGNIEDSWLGEHEKNRSGSVEDISLNDDSLDGGMDSIDLGSPTKEVQSFENVDSNSTNWMPPVELNSPSIGSIESKKGNNSVGETSLPSNSAVSGFSSVVGKTFAHLNKLRDLTKSSGYDTDSKIERCLNLGIDTYSEDQLTELDREVSASYNNLDQLPGDRIKFGGEAMTSVEVDRVIQAGLDTRSDQQLDRLDRKVRSLWETHTLVDDTVAVSGPEKEQDQAGNFLTNIVGLQQISDESNEELLRLEEHEAENERRTAELERKENDLSKKEESLYHKEVTLGQREAQIGLKEADLVEQARQAEYRKQNLDSHQTEVDRLHLEFQRKEQEVDSRALELQRREADLEKRTLELETKQYQLETETQSLQQSRQEEDRTTMQLKEYEKKISSYEAENLKLKKTIAQQLGTISTCQGLKEKNEQYIKALGEEEQRRTSIMILQSLCVRLEHLVGDNLQKQLVDSLLSDNSESSSTALQMQQGIISNLQDEVSRLQLKVLPPALSMPPYVEPNEGMLSDPEEQCIAALKNVVKMSLPPEPTVDDFEELANDLNPEGLCWHSEHTDDEKFASELVDKLQQQHLLESSRRIQTEFISKCSKKLYEKSKQLVQLEADYCQLGRASLGLIAALRKSNNTPKIEDDDLPPTAPSTPVAVETDSIDPPPRSPVGIQTDVPNHAPTTPSTPVAVQTDSVDPPACSPVGIQTDAPMHDAVAIQTDQIKSFAHPAVAENDTKSAPVGVQTDSVHIEEAASQTLGGLSADLDNKGQIVSDVESGSVSVSNNEPQDSERSITAKTADKTLVDKKLAASVVAKCIERNCRRDCLDIVASVLDFSDEERKRVGLIQQEGFFDSFLPGWSRSQAKAQNVNMDEQSFSNLLTDFIQDEIS